MLRRFCRLGHAHHQAGRPRRYGLFLDRQSCRRLRSNPIKFKPNRRPSVAPMSSNEHEQAAQPAQSAAPLQPDTQQQQQQPALHMYDLQQEQRQFIAAPPPPGGFAGPRPAAPAAAGESAALRQMYAVQAPAFEARRALEPLKVRIKRAKNSTNNDESDMWN